MTVSPYGNLGFREGFGASSWFSAESCWALGGTGRHWEALGQCADRLREMLLHCRIPTVVGFSRWTFWGRR